MKNYLAAATAVALALGVPLAGNAQNAEAETLDVASATEGLTLSQIEPAAGFSNDTIDDAKIDSFIQAVSRIGVVGIHYRQLVENEPDEEKHPFLIETANKDIVRAIEVTENITPAEYLAIDQASQADSELNDRILARIKEIQAEKKPTERLQFSIPNAE